MLVRQIKIFDPNWVLSMSWTIESTREWSALDVRSVARQAKLTSAPGGGSTSSGGGGSGGGGGQEQRMPLARAKYSGARLAVLDDPRKRAGRHQRLLQYSGGGGGGETPDNDDAHRVANRSRVAQNDASSEPPPHTQSSSWSDSTVQQQQQQLVQRQAALLAGALQTSALHARRPGHCQQQVALRHAAPQAGVLHAGALRAAQLQWHPCCNALRWTLARCTPVRCALCSQSARGQGLAQRHAALRPGAQHTGAQVAALR